MDKADAKTERSSTMEKETIKQSVPEYFGSMVFNDEVMRESLPKDI